MVNVNDIDAAIFATIDNVLFCIRTRNSKHCFEHKKCKRTIARDVISLALSNSAFNNPKINDCWGCARNDPWAQ